jgi:hypothetical protein
MLQQQQLRRQWQRCHDECPYQKLLNISAHAADAGLDCGADQLTEVLLDLQTDAYQ